MFRSGPSSDHHAARRWVRPCIYVATDFGICHNGFLRCEARGASLLALLRNIGAAIGVSVTSTVLARSTQALHEMIGASATPFNRALQAIEAFNPATHHGAAMLD